MDPRVRRWGRAVGSVERTAVRVSAGEWAWGIVQGGLFCWRRWSGYDGRCGWVWRVRWGGGLVCGRVNAVGWSVSVVGGVSGVFRCSAGCCVVRRC